MSAGIDARDFCTSLYDLEKEILEAAEGAVADAVTVALKSAQSTTLFNDRTMALRASMRGYAVGYRGVVQAGGRAARHGLWVHDGTKPHIIRARRAPYLVFQVAGQWRRAKEVRHPGTKPRPFLVEAGRLGGEALERSLERLTSAAIGRSNA